MKHTIAFGNKRRPCFTLVEMVLATAIGALVVGALVVSLYQVSEVTRGFQDTMEASGQIQSVANVLNHDTMAASSSQSAPGQLTLYVPEHNFGVASLPITHTITYQFNASDGTLARCDGQGGSAIVGRNLVSVAFSATQGIDSAGIITAHITAEEHGLQDQAVLVFHQRAEE